MSLNFYLRLVQKTGRELNRDVGLSPGDDDNSTLPVLTVIHKFTFLKRKKKQKRKPMMIVNRCELM
jgi:hypothetical protein